jgi:N-acyl-D-amino-acid deacylase
MTTQYDVILRNGTIYDGSGSTPYKGDLAILGQQIAQIGNLGDARAKVELDVQGLAVAPGFINVMSWAPITSLVDGRSQSDIRQGVTMEVFGESWSEGPLSPEMKAAYQKEQGDIKFDVAWNTLGEFLDHLAKKGVSTNIASYLGMATLRVNAVGYSDRRLNENELDLMRRLAAQAMEEGALGLSTALIYPPDSYNTTEDIIEIAKVVAKYNGIYISHMRSEGNTILEALDEFLHITHAANIWSEIYHLKAMGKDNWPKMDQVLAKVEAARAEGLHVTADMYTYTAGGTGLGANMPQWCQEGGTEAWIARLKDPVTRARIRQEMLQDTNEWENMRMMTAGPEGIILVGFDKEENKIYTGKTLAEISAMRGTDPVDTIMDLVIADGSGCSAVYFTMSEENKEKEMKKPWVSIGSDASSQSPEGVFLKSSTHPRAYGCFARYLGHYVRERALMPLEEAIRKITSLPAANLKISKRGALKAGYFADVTVFDPATIKDNATYQKPQVFATGVSHVFVNGAQVLKDGEHTGALPGQVVRGPGYRK